jgi:hypothetical protein
MGLAMSFHFVDYDSWRTCSRDGRPIRPHAKESKRHCPTAPLIRLFCFEWRTDSPNAMNEKEPPARGTNRFRPALRHLENPCIPANTPLGKRKMPHPEAFFTVLLCQRLSVLPNVLRRRRATRGQCFRARSHSQTRITVHPSLRKDRVTSLSRALLRASFAAHHSGRVFSIGLSIGFGLAQPFFRA